MQTAMTQISLHTHEIEVEQKTQTSHMGES